MLTVEQARRIAAEFRPQFADESFFEQSVSRFFDMTGDPTADKLHHWLSKDLAKDAVRSAFIVREPVVPMPQDFSLPADLEDTLVARGDEHDWTGINEPGWTVGLHAKNCRRCQLGAESRQAVDDRAQTASKHPFPTLGSSAHWTHGS